MRIKNTIVSVAALCVFLSGCASASTSHQSDKVNVVATTPIIADIVKNVTRDKANVTALVPNGADPHSYEPTFRQTRDVANADIAFSNYLTLEEQAVIKMLDANLPKKVQNIALAESAIPKGIKTINLVENRALDTIWLGLRVEGEGKKDTDTRSQQVEISLKKLVGPGKMFGYLTESFGEPNIYFDSTNKDSRTKAVLPIDAHTHMSWAFTKPGIYKATFVAKHKDNKTNKVTDVKESTFTFAVGVDAHKKFPGKKVFDKNHADITVDLKDKKLKFSAAVAEGDQAHSHVEEEQGKDSQTNHNESNHEHEHDVNTNGDEHNHDEHGHDDEDSHVHGQDSEHAHLHQDYDAKDVIIEVPNKAISQVPSEIEYKFLGKAGESIYLLPQAVLGKHVHGELDPHLWLNAENVKYYVDVIAEKLSEIDPKNKNNYDKNATEYKEKLDKLHHRLLEEVKQIPIENRQLVTTHDSFGYFAKAYGVKVAGFVTPNPSTQPSVAERKKLTETIHNLKVKAVFLEPNIIAKSSVLKQIADEQGVKVCSIWSDTFTDNITNYIQMMDANIKSMKKCLK